MVFDWLDVWFHMMDSARHYFSLTVYNTTKCNTSFSKCFE